MSLSSPRFRRDLVPSGVEVGGVQYVEVRDPKTGNVFRFYDFEHAVALALDGSALEEVVSSLREAPGFELTIEQLTAFAGRLEELGFLEQPAASAGVAADALAKGKGPQAPEPAGAAAPKASAAAAVATAPGAQTSPTPVGPRPPARPVPTSRRSRVLLYAIFGIIAALAIAFVAYRMMARGEPRAVSVRTFVPSPGSVYRWFELSGTIKQVGAPVMPLPSAGKVIHVLAAGSRFSAGDVLAATDAARRLQNDLSHHRERLAYYQQILETMRTAGNRPETRQAEIKVAEKQRLVAQTLESLAKVAIVAPAAGEVAEVLVTVGTVIKPGTPAVRLKGERWRAEFAVTREGADQVRRLGFCRVEIEGQPIDCKLAGDGDPALVSVELPAHAAVAAGKAVRLAKARYDGVFAVPASAVVQVGSTERLYVAAPTGRAEVRAVALADRSGNEAIVAQGLDVGDQVIVDLPPQLRPNARVRVTATRRQ